MKIVDLLLNNKHSEEISLYYQDTPYTYQYLYQKAKSLENYIKNINTVRCNIAIILPNSHQYIVAFFSTLMSENIIVPIYDKSTANEIINTLNTFDIAIIISKKDIIETILSKKDEINHKFACIDIDREIVHIDNTNLLFPKTLAPQNTALLLGTSGSVSNPRRVMLSDDNILSNVSSIVETMNYNHTDRFLVILPMCFSSANTAQLLVAFFLKIPLIIYNDSLHPARIINVCNRYEITATAVVPTLARTLALFFENNNVAFKTLRSIACGGAPLNSRELEPITKRNPTVQIANVYGLTEAAPRLSIEKEALKFPGSVGFPIRDVEIHIACELNDDDTLCGQVIARGPNVMCGYYKNALATSQVLKNGYLYTGDLGQIVDGRLYILGREKNIIIVNGINVYPEEIEEVIISHSAVSEVLVKGKENVVFGNIPVAYIVLKKACTTTELYNYCRKHLPLFKIPAEFVFVDQLKKTYNGKLERN